MGALSTTLLIATNIPLSHGGGPSMPKHPFAGGSSLPELHDLNWTCLEHCAGLRFTAPQRERLLKALNHYLENLSWYYQTPETRDVTRKIHTLQTALAALQREVLRHLPSDLSGDQMNAQDHLHSAVLGETFPFELVDPSTFIHVLIAWNLKAQQVLKRLPKEPADGRTPHHGLCAMIRAWHAVYLEAGGKGKGCTRSGGAKEPTSKGPLLDVIDAALECARNSPQVRLPREAFSMSRDALAQQVLKALRTS
jgi:hypothetical protein